MFDNFKCAGHDNIINNIINIMFCSVLIIYKFLTTSQIMPVVVLAPNWLGLNRLIKSRSVTRGSVTRGSV